MVDQGHLLMDSKECWADISNKSLTNQEICQVDGCLTLLTMQAYIATVWCIGDPSYSALIRISIGWERGEEKARTVRTSPESLGHSLGVSQRAGSRQAAQWEVAWSSGDKRATGWE